LKIENGCPTVLQTFPIFACASLGYYERFSQLWCHVIPNRIKAKDPGIDSTFESLMNFKRDLTLLEKFDKFSKNPS
jgi:hypothetical protein